MEVMSDDAAKLLCQTAIMIAILLLVAFKDISPLWMLLAVLFG